MERGRFRLKGSYLRYWFWLGHMCVRLWWWQPLLSGRLLLMKSFLLDSFEHQRGGAQSLQRLDSGC